MMKRWSLYFLLFFFALCVSCDKKKYPETLVVQPETVFGFNGSVNGKPVTINAGVDNYYMYSSYAQDSNGVYNFIGELKQKACANCPSLKIQINDFKISSPGGNMLIDSSLALKTYKILSGTKAYRVTFQSSFNKQAVSYDWDFGDGSTSTASNPTHDFFNSGQYQVNLKIKSANGCESFIGNKQNIDVSSSTCKTFIGITGLSGNTVFFTQTTSGGKAPYKYFWNFGDGDTANVLSPIHNYLVGGSYFVTLKVTDANGVITTANYNAVTQNDASSCAANYNIQSINAVPNPNVSLSKIIVTWKDSNGVVYTSNNETQPLSSYFDLVQIENYDKNENNQSTKKLKVKFKCMVYNGSKAVLIDNAEAVIAVAYK